MDGKNVKKRDVLSFEDFAKAQDKAKKVIELKAGEKPHYGIKDIKGEAPYVRNDANPYVAMQIPHDEKIANANDFIQAKTVDVQEKPHDGQDPIAK